MDTFFNSISVSYILNLQCPARIHKTILAVLQLLLISKDDFLQSYPVRWWLTYRQPPAYLHPLLPISQIHLFRSFEIYSLIILKVGSDPVNCLLESCFPNMSILSLPQSPQCPGILISFIFFIAFVIRLQKKNRSMFDEL